MTQLQGALSVIARAPFTVYYEGQAEVISATNKVGRFDVLPGHADFFSILQSDEVLIQPGGGKDPVSFTINNGIMTVRDNEVLLFVDM